MNLEALTNMEYPGRFIIMGADPDGDCVVVYGVTGRSASSKARKLEIDEKGEWIYVRATDEEVIKQGRRDLLEYPAMFIGENIAVSNGKHTEDIVRCFGLEKNPTDILSKAYQNWSFEDDAPNFTPRIGGCLYNGEACLAIIRRNSLGAPGKTYFQIPLIAGKGKMIATYTGVNVGSGETLPSFKGDLLDVDLTERNSEKTAKSVYAALNPDFRVGVVAVHHDYNPDFAEGVVELQPEEVKPASHISIINRKQE